jgi:hypothetical protein
MMRRHPTSEHGPQIHRSSPTDSELGLNSSGTDHADFDSMGPKFLIEGLCESDLSKFGRTVNRFSGKTVNAGHRGKHQDRAPPLLEHDWWRGSFARRLTSLEGVNKNDPCGQ